MVSFTNDPADIFKQNGLEIKKASLSDQQRLRDYHYPLFLNETTKYPGEREHQIQKKKDDFPISTPVSSLQGATTPY